MKASDVMTHSVVTVTPTTTLADAARSMLEHRISGLPVLDAAGTVVGMITEADLLRRAEIGTDRRASWWRSLMIGEERLAAQYVHSHARKIEELMNRDIIAVGPDTPLSDVVALMEARAVKRVLVLQEGRLVGIVTRADLLRALEQLLKRQTDAAHSMATTDATIQRSIQAELRRQGWAPQHAVGCQGA